MFSMKSFVAVALVAGAVVAQESPYPACTNPCLANVDLHGCKSGQDLECLCRSEPFIAETTACFIKECTDPTQLAQALAVSQGACAVAGVTFSSAPPSGPTGSSASTPPPSSSAPSGSASAPRGSSTVPSSSSPSLSGSAPAASSPSGNAATANAIHLSGGLLAGIAAFIGLAL